MVDVNTTPQLLRAVDDVVDVHGWTGATAERIAEAAGVNRTTLYRNGHSSATLLAAAVSTAAEEFRRSAVEPLATAGSARHRMGELLEVLYDLADQHLGLLAGLYDGSSVLFHLQENPDGLQAVTRFEYTEPFSRLLSDGRLDGSLTCENPDEDAELIFNTAGWTYIHLRRSHGWPDERVRRQVTRVTLAAFTTD